MKAKWNDSNVVAGRGSGGYHADIDNPRLFGDFCSMEALERLGR